MLKELPGLKNLNIENNNLDIVNLKADVFESKLEKLNVNRFDFEEIFESLLKHVKFPELRELNMISCNVDSEFPFFLDQCFYLKLKIWFWMIMILIAFRGNSKRSKV